MPPNIGVSACRHGHSRGKGVAYAAAIMATDASATPCRATASGSPVPAARRSPAAPSPPDTATSARSPTRAATLAMQQHRDIGAGIEERCKHGEPQRRSGGWPQVPAQRRDGDDEHAGRNAGKHQGPQPGFHRCLIDQDEVQPERHAGTTVSQATFAVNGCGLTSSSVASRHTSATAAFSSPRRRRRSGRAAHPARGRPRRGCRPPGSRSAATRPRWVPHPERRKTTTPRRPARYRTTHPR